MVVGEAHVHQTLGRRKVVRLGALKQNYGKVLRQTVEGRLGDTLVIVALERKQR